MADRISGGTAGAHKTSWLDALPHNFTGWGPKTPDPDHPELASPAGELSWDGGDDHRQHLVWTFDARRHHH